MCEARALRGNCPPPHRVLTITAIAQLFVLGCTWVFGLFLFDQRSWVLCYVFSVLNSLQGLLLFVLHCLLNKKAGCRPGCGRGWDPRPGAPPPLTWHPVPHR